MTEFACEMLTSGGNPGSGDPIGIVMIAMGICSLICGLMILFHKKKEGD